jgi:Zn-dependent M28 family amino/carboxypeptidase
MDATFDLPALTERLRQHVATLARTPRLVGTAEHRRAASYIRKHFEQSGFSVQAQGFEAEGKEGVNLLTLPQAEQDDLPLLVVGAHYDTIPRSPGADDNASAVAALLELARWLQPVIDAGGPFRSRIQLVAYDLEEWGLLGSAVHASDLRGKAVALRGMISLEMLGYTNPVAGGQKMPAALAGLYPDVGDFIGVVANEASRGLLEVVTEGLKSVPSLPVQSLAVPGCGEMLSVTTLSDHSSFWQCDYPALMITDTSFFRNQHYHTAEDTPETLDYPFLARVTVGVCEAVRRLLR